jgi:hypothetical protein
MTIIVEDGSGLANAETYCTVAEADAYHTLRGNATWADLDLDVKEALLRKAADYMLQAYRLRWQGYRVKTTQALDWPRQGVSLPDNFAYGYSYLSSTVVPVEVKNACAVLAWKSNSLTLNPDSDRVTSSESVGPVSVTYDLSSPSAPIFNEVDAILSIYIAGGGGMSMPLVRT